MPYCFSTRQPPRILGTASLGSLHAKSARHVYQSPLTRGGHSSSIVSSCGFRGGERVGETKRTWPSPDKGRNMSAFTERITGSQVGGATEITRATSSALCSASRSEGVG